MMKIHLLLVICLEINAIVCANDTRIEEIKQFDKEYSSSINSEDLEDSVELPRHKPSGCICRQYTIRKFVTCFDPVLCKRFPSDVKFRYKSIRLSTTAIAALFKGDLDRNAHLTVFNIEANVQFERIQPGSFQGMTNLHNLSLTQNPKLIYLDRDAFEGLVNLKHLLLKQNGFLQLSGFVAAMDGAHLPRLKNLEISQMIFSRITENDFADLVGTAVENLSLLACKIESIHPKALNVFEKLLTLKLGANDLNANHTAGLIKAMMDGGIGLKSLGLNSMFFKELPFGLLEVIAQSNISSLSLSGNRFELIEAFPLMPNLEELKLVGCWILNITNDAFKALPKLKTLYISHNQFAESPSAVLLENLTYLDISYSGQYFTIQDIEIFKNMKKLRHLHLSGNNIRKISNITFTGLENLEVLGLKSSTLFFIEHAAFLPLKNLIFLDLRDNQFPTRNFSKHVFEGLGNLQVLLLGNCRISNIEADSEIFAGMRSLQHLGLENNYLKTLPAAILTPLKNLERLDISMNLFVAWNKSMLTEGNKLKTLIAYDNKIRNITHSMISDFVNLTSISLQKNPFACQCDDFAGLNEIIYMQKYAEIFNLLSKHRLFCTFPDQFSNFTILDYFDYIQKKDICAVKYSEQSMLILFGIVILVITAILAVFLYTNRNHITYYCFQINMNLLNRHKCYRTSSKCKYDAFVSYCSEDCAFVEKLVNFLENEEPFFKLCVYERDFQIGSEISESVIESMESSRKILIIASQAYANSHWCRFEVKIADNKRLFENENGEFKENSIIIVRLGKLCVKNLSPMLRHFIASRIYLEFDEMDEKKFNRKLKQALGYEDRRLVVRNKALF